MIAYQILRSKSQDMILLGPVYTIPDSLVTTSSFAVTEQWLVANAY